MRNSKLIRTYIPDLVEALEGLLVSALVFLALSLIVGSVDARTGKEGLGGNSIETFLA